jgi:hypothetical protein
MILLATASSNSDLAAQVLTLAIPLGTFCVALLIGYFARYRQR